jgi:hypothetical protein
MPLVIGMAWGVVLAYAAGRRPDGFGNGQLERLWFVIPLFVLQGVARGRLGTAASDLGLLLWAGAATAVCVYVLWQVTDLGLRLIGAGFAANLLVVLLNGYMPVSLVGFPANPDFAAWVAPAAFYVGVNEATLVSFLGDVLPILFFGDRYLLSVGDVLLLVGCALQLFGHPRPLPVLAVRDSGSSKSADGGTGSASNLEDPSMVGVHGQVSRTWRGGV